MSLDDVYLLHALPAPYSTEPRLKKHSVTTLQIEDSSRELRQGQGTHTRALVGTGAEQEITK